MLSCNDRAKRRKAFETRRVCAVRGVRVVSNDRATRRKAFETFRNTRNILPMPARCNDRAKRRKAFETLSSCTFFNVTSLRVMIVLNAERHLRPSSRPE